MLDAYESVIGIEIHVQLSTRSKMFCSCPTKYGAPANTQVCPVCLGLPGALPRLNQRAVELAAIFGSAVGGQVAATSLFARKNYFYPDLPKGYQITQYKHPVVTGGKIPFWTGGEQRELALTRAHLEEDAGKLLHPEGGDRFTRIDLNRAGIPLLEIVSEPCLHSPEEAAAALERIHQLVVYLGISNANMEEGNLRCDANISVRPRTQPHFNPKTEIKNLNSYRHVQKALEYEVTRQSLALEEGEPLVQATRLWDEATGRTGVMRTKEDAEDYRYFPEPDLPPAVLAAPASPGETPWHAEARLMKDFGLSLKDSRLLTSNQELARYFEGAAAVCGDPKRAANWVLTEVLQVLGERQISPSQLKVSPEACGRLLKMLSSGKINGPTAKAVFQRVVESGKDPESIIAKEGLNQVSDAGILETEVRAALESHPTQVQQYLGGKETVAQFFVGQVMRATQGRANPKTVLATVLSELARIQKDDG